METEKIQWQPLSIVLKKIYSDMDILEQFEKDENYLKNAFEFTEKLWIEQFNEIDKIKVIMVSEAPLYGEKKNYIYNFLTPPSIFFHFNDLQVFIKNNNSIKKPIKIIDQKKMMLDYFQKYGFIILDIFPYALNPKYTSLHYRKMDKKLYSKLLEITLSHYLMPKLKLCFGKTDDKIIFLYRYKRLFDKTNNFLKKMLQNTVPQNIEYHIDSIHGSNMSLDRDKLKSFLI